MVVSAPGNPRDRIDNFYMLVGRCIASWADVDDWLFKICYRAIDGKYEQTAIMYYRLPGLDVRLNLVDELVKSLFPKKPGEKDHPLLFTWKKQIVHDIRDELSIRRRIAHQPVTAITTNWMAFFTNPEKYGGADLRIQVGAHEKLRNKESDVSPLEIADLIKHSIKVDEISESLNLFYEQLSGHVLSP